MTINHDALQHAQQAGVFRAQGKLDAAMHAYQQTLALQPDFALAHCGIAEIYNEKNDAKNAIHYYEQAIALQPNLILAQNNLGVLYHAEGRFNDAVQCYRRVLAQTPDDAKMLHNLGDALADLGEFDAAINYYNRALAINPDLDYATHSKATVQLLQGDYKNGWQGYEARWAAGIAGLPMREYPWPLWDGANPLSSFGHGKILIWGEQGIGDEIMFAGLIPDAARRADNNLVIDCANARLLPLVQRSFPNIKIIAGGAAPDDIIAHLPISSLPRLFRNSAADFAATTSPYLVADAALVQEFRARYNNGSPRIGLAWHTNSRKAGRLRAIPLADFAPLFEAAPQAAWINLQYGQSDTLAAEIRAAGAPLFTDAAVDQLRDIDGFAAQIAALDLVITIDNTTAHLAGALGIPTWLLLPTVPNWRWLLGRADSPWYPNIRIFRQPTPADWQSVIQDLVVQISARKTGPNFSNFSKNT